MKSEMLFLYKDIGDCVIHISNTPYDWKNLEIGHLESLYILWCIYICKTFYTC
jgi:hypothetical protein